MLDDARADGQGTQMSGLGSKEGCQRLQHERFVLCGTDLTTQLLASRACMQFRSFFSSQRS